MGIATLAKPEGGLHHIVHPDFPSRVAKIPTTVTATEKVHLQNPVTRMRECAGLRRCHVAGFVHLFSKRVDIEHQTPQRGCLCWVK